MVTRKGIQHIHTGIRNLRTMKSQLDKSRIKTPQGALVEMARLSQEKRMCQVEMGHWEQRIQHLQQRLDDIAEADMWLRSFVDQAEQREQPSAPEAASATPPPSPHQVTFRY